MPPLGEKKGDSRKLESPPDTTAAIPNLAFAGVPPSRRPLFCPAAPSSRCLVGGPSSPWLKTKP
jgi:hypothetical protein